MLYQTTDFKAGDFFMTGVRLYCVEANGVAGQRAVTCRQVVNGKPSSRLERVTMDRVTHKLSFSRLYDGYGQPEDVTNRPRYEEQPAVAQERARTEPVAATAPVERFRLRMANASAAVATQARMF